MAYPISSPTASVHPSLSQGDSMELSSAQGHARGHAETHAVNSQVDLPHANPALPPLPLRLPHSNPSEPAATSALDDKAPLQHSESASSSHIPESISPIKVDQPSHNVAAAASTSSASALVSLASSSASAPAPAALTLAPSALSPASIPAPSQSTSPTFLLSPSKETVPRQTILKALASVARSNKPEALSLNGMLSAQAVADGQTSSTSSQNLADALNDIAKSRTTPTTAFPALQSPCFYHQRFDDAVDIEKVLEEIKNDQSMSHSRLVQTATSVREVSKQLQRRPIKRAVRSVMIVTKARDNQLVYLTRELAGWLLRTPRYGSDVGVTVYVDAKLRNSRRFDSSGLLAENPRFQHMLKYWTPDLCWSQPDKFDLVLTLGGDGTVLFTSWLFQRVVPPILSFSLGSLGFMTTFEFEKYKEHLNRVMGDDGMKINLRMRFTCTVYRNAADNNGVEEAEQFEVLNELVIDRGPSPYVSQLELYGDDDLLTVIQADGCIFSTPTGSTAYSLSAGGSLVHPDIPAILLTPICPHTLSFRPMVLSDTMALRVAVPIDSRATAYCAFDGKGRVELRQGDHVTITASQYPFPTVTRTDTEWFDSVSRTLRWNVRAAAQKPFDAKAVAPGMPNEDSEDLGWDIDTDSAYYASEAGSVSTSPVRRQMSMLGF